MAGGTKSGLRSLPDEIRTPVERQIWLCTLTSCMPAVLTSDNLRQMERAMAVVTVFQAIVLGDRRSIDQMKLE